MMTESNNTLTPDGANRLREARDYIATHPDTFCMVHWVGPTMCIGGTLEYLELRRKGINLPFGRDLYSFFSPYNGDVNGLFKVFKLLGFNGPISQTSPVYELFFRWDHWRSRDAEYGVERINEILTLYGYPIDEPIAIQEPEAELALA